MSNILIKMIKLESTQNTTANYKFLFSVKIAKMYLYFSYATYK